MTDIFFPDLSEYQANVDFTALRGQCAVCIEQISWGTDVTIPAGRLAAMRAARFDLIIWYMGITGADSAAQVAAFTDTLGPLLANEAVCLDWESTGNSPAESVAQRDEIQSLLAQHYGIPKTKVGIYGPNSALAQNPPDGWVWTASYETSEPSIPHAIWQFTDGTYVSPPYSPISFAGVGYCDASVFHGTVAELVAIVCANATPSPSPSPSPTQEATDMAGYDPISGGSWGVEPNGAVYANDGAPYLGGLNNHPEWHTPAIGPAAGIVFWKGDGTDAAGNGYSIYVNTGSGFDLYRFPRSGAYRGPA